MTSAGNRKATKSVVGGVAGLLVCAFGVGCAGHADHAHGEAAVPQAIVLAFDTEYQPLLNGPPQTCGMRSGRVVVVNGECGELHSTGAHEETLVILSGRGALRWGDDQVLPTAGGQIVYVPPHTSHHVCADPGEELRYVYVVAPVSHP